MRLKKITNLIKLIKLNQLAAQWQQCDLCGWNLQLKLFNNEMGVRCSRCKATPVSQMMGKVFNQNININTKHIYELSSRGPFVKYLKKLSIKLTISEYFPDIKPGKFKNEVECQNVEHLTYKDEQFDVVTSLEVFEHVENDIQGFKEIFRVLKSNGIFIFTVPIDLKNKTIERTKMVNGIRENILPEEYHSDNLRGDNQVFCYRNYGVDIIERLKLVGFSKCAIRQPYEKEYFGYGRPVICAYKQ